MYAKVMSYNNNSDPIFKEMDEPDHEVDSNPGSAPT